MAEGGVAELETQRADTAALMKTPLKKGDTWYLVDSRWFKQWKKYVGFDSWDKYQMGDQNVYPGPIDNSGLLKELLNKSNSSILWIQRTLSHKTQSRW
ncbi:ubiquitin carboxyl-terminal hydrolase 15-like [Hemitrygon akajei]|uniref:ubiquitin carboxyl-terminal hydrolase 15-like n=1 Tax=Hemitrygon akajei TaxID=2704970 RepID=UPI003BF9D27A